MKRMLLIAACVFALSTAQARQIPDLKFDPGWEQDRFPEHAVCYKTPEAIQALYRTMDRNAVLRLPKPEDGALRIVGTGHSFMAPGYKTFPVICRAAGFTQPLLTHTGGGITGSARYKWEQENGIFQFDRKPRPKLLAAISTGEWDAMMWGPYYRDRPAFYRCWIDFCVRYNPKMEFYLSDAWPSLRHFDRRPTREDAETVKDFVRIGREIRETYGKLIAALDEKHPDKVHIMPTSDAMVLAVQRFHAGKLPGIDGIHRLIGGKDRSLWRDQIGHLGPGLEWLEGYVFYSTIYKRSAAQIKGEVVRAGRVDRRGRKQTPPGRELDRIFREIAWEAVVNNPYSDVTDENRNGIGDQLEK
jgi:hypothetical protein